MSNYLVSARKYRPTTFSSVVGQGALTTTLKNSIASGRLAHAYLFCGPRGVGKTTCARIFAKTINCLSPQPGGEACEQCESCRAFNEQRSLNIRELDAASNNSVQDIRNLIEQVGTPPQIGHYKVFIVDEVHMLSTAAFNAFLKTLEEPPAHAIFILATTEKNRLLATILSRCQIYDFSRISTRDIVAQLERVAQSEGITYEPQALHVIAQKADGGMRDALSTFDQVAAYCQGNITYQQTIEDLNELDCAYYFRIVDQMLGGDVTGILLLLDEVLSKGFEGNQFVLGLGTHLRHLLLSRDAQTLPLIETSEEIRTQYGQQAQRCQPSFLFAALRKCTDCDLNYRASQNKRLLVELTLIEIAQLTARDNGAPAPSPGPAKALSPINPSAQQTPSAQQVRPAAPPAPRAGHTIAPPPGQSKGGAATARPHPAMGFSISGGGFTGKQTGGQAQAAAAPRATTTHQPLTAERLVVAWRSFMAALPNEKKAQAKRLEGVKPTLLPDGGFEIAFDNPSMEAMLRELKADIEPYMQQTFDSPTLAMRIRQRTAAEMPKLLNKQEQYAEMQRQNPQLTHLSERLELTLE